MSQPPRYSVVIPVYNRPEELDELLQSLTLQTFRDFEVIVVDDGSQTSAREVYEKYSRTLSIQYFFKPNTGPGPSRNFGFERARGSYFVLFDSDCMVPPHYFESVERALVAEGLDAWGGPDRGHEKFTPLQQAMAFTMSSVLTTGGIRGGSRQRSGFQPRSFNMGISRKVFETTGGFAFDRLAEDIELSVRMKQAGFRAGLVPDAFVYHKRRATLGEFFHQVQGFGRGRVRVGKVHPGEVKIAHWFPVFFLIGLLFIPVGIVVDSRMGYAMTMLMALYLAAIFLDGYRTTHSFQVALRCVPAAVVQLSGYGLGFIQEKIKP